MMQKIGTAEFRNNLKKYMDSAADGRGNVIRLSPSSGEQELFLMSKETFARLQERHCLNTAAKDQFGSLKLNNYMTLAKGAKTKDLPIGTILGLSAFFGLVSELLSDLARPGAQTNATKWDVSDHVKGTAKDAPDRHFTGVRETMKSLWAPEAVQQAQEGPCTLYRFFSCMHDTQACIRRDGLDDGQYGMVCEIIGDASVWASLLMDAQTLDPRRLPPKDLSNGMIWLVFEGILYWHHKYVLGQEESSEGLDG